MTIDSDAHDQAADISILMATPPAIRERNFTRHVMQSAQKQLRHRTLFLSAVWMLALTGLLVVLLGLGVDNTLAAFLQQAGALVAELDRVSDLNLTSGLAVVAELDLLTLQSTGLLTLTATVLLVLVFATTSLLD